MGTFINWPLQKGFNPFLNVENIKTANFFSLWMVNFDNKKTLWICDF